MRFCTDSSTDVSDTCCTHPTCCVVYLRRALCTRAVCCVLALRCLGQDFYITGFSLVGCGPLYLGTVWLQIFMYGFVAMNIVTWANKHNHSVFKELALMFSHPIRPRQCGPPQKLGYEPVQTQVTNDVSIEPEDQEVLDMQHVKGV